MAENKRRYDGPMYMNNVAEVAWTEYKGIDDTCNEWWWNEETMPVVRFQDVFGDEEFCVPCVAETAVACSQAIDGQVYLPLSFVSTEERRTLTLTEDPFASIQASYTIGSPVPTLVGGFVAGMDGLWRPSIMFQGLVRIYSIAAEAHDYCVAVCVPNIIEITELPVDQVLDALKTAGRHPFRSAGCSIDVEFPPGVFPLGSVYAAVMDQELERKEKQWRENQLEIFADGRSAFMSEPSELEKGTG